ncbi:hypothetical protein PCANC_07431 [Puccinia coronata f. sp. avenae]|uniref:Retrotransposon gag domain-containing protein n=1 Tax=Puccinia coronata f. sp. avenae TaxID=200324 RepID=A0A2N5T456_9BASI|nr:hypothetical protein PCANC_07431 [Puccinia coronata f. sp. avenae]
MTTRRQAGDELHALVPDPKAIIQAGNQERRRQHQLDNLERHRQASLAARKARLAASRIPLPSSPTLRPASPQRSEPIPATSSLATPDPPRPNLTQTHQELKPSVTFMENLHPTGSNTGGLPHSVDSRNTALSMGETTRESHATLMADQLRTEEFLRALMATQQSAIQQAQLDCQHVMAEARAQVAQAQSDREASARRIARLEEAIMLLSVRPEPTPTATNTTTPTNGRIDLQRFRATDGPIYSGPARAVEPFINWMQSVQIFFSTKGVTHDLEKLHIVGALLRKTNTLAFYTSCVPQLETYLWDQFKQTLFDFALPPLWRSGLREKIITIKMGDTESLLGYSTRARTLQSILNFDQPLLTDFQLAELVAIGLPADLRAPGPMNYH